MIVYCGLRHFYVRHFELSHPTRSQTDAYYILTHNKYVWDFSPELKERGFTPRQTSPSAIKVDRGGSFSKLPCK